MQILATYTVSFFGHHQVNDVFKLECALEKIIELLLQEKEYVEFLVGRDVEFGQIVASAVKRCKCRYGESNSSLVWVLAYPTVELQNNEKNFCNYYDEIEICEKSEQSHFKAAIQIRNHTMVDRSDLVVFFVERKKGGAYQTIEYTKKHGITWINLQKVNREVKSLVKDSGPSIRNW